MPGFRLQSIQLSYFYWKCTSKMAPHWVPVLPWFLRHTCVTCWCNLWKCKSSAAHPAVAIGGRGTRRCFAACVGACGRQPCAWTYPGCPVAHVSRWRNVDAKEAAKLLLSWHLALPEFLRPPATPTFASPTYPAGTPPVKKRKKVLKGWWAKGLAAAAIALGIKKKATRKSAPVPEVTPPAPRPSSAPQW
jgi:hypothetical protein